MCATTLLEERAKQGKDARQREVLFATRSRRTCREISLRFLTVSGEKLDSAPKMFLLSFEKGVGYSTNFTSTYPNLLEPQSKATRNIATGDWPPNGCRTD